MKVAINKCFGGFDLSEKFYAKLRDYGVHYYDSFEIFKKEYLDDGSIYMYKGDSFIGMCSNIDSDRTNPLLIKVIESVGEKESSGRFGNIQIVEIPDDISWEISDYDGMESVRETSRSWG
jgi:hypothetical protein